MRVRSPSTTLTLTCRVSPGSKSGMSLPAESFAACSCSSCSIKFIGILRRPRRFTRGAHRLLVSGCAGFYAKHAVLSPFRHGLLGPPREISRPQIWPPFAGDPLCLGAAPGRDFGVITGQKLLWDRPAFEHWRPCELRVFQKPVGKALLGDRRLGPNHARD